MKFIWENEIYKDNVSLAVSSNASGFSFSNLLDRSTEVRVIFLGKTDESVTVDAGAGNTLTASGLGLFGFNFTSSVTITLMADPAADWGSPDFSETVTYNSEGIAHLFTEQTYRYWRVRMQDATNSENLQLGILYLGAEQDVAYISPNFSFNRSISTRNSFTRSRQVRGTKKRSYYDLKFNLSHVTESRRGELLDVWNYHHNVEPLVLLIWEDSLSIQAPIYGVLNQNDFQFKRRKEEGLSYTSRFSFLEVF